MSKMIGPDFVSLQVSDLEASRGFYVESVGLTPAAKSPPDAVVFDTQPIPFAIRRPLVDLSVADGRLGWGVSLWFACDDAEGLHSKLVAAGTAIVSPPGDGPFGRFFVFRDPDGYTLTAHQATPPQA